MTGHHAASTARELFDQLYHSSRYSFYDSPFLQMGGGLHTSQVIPKRPTCKFVFLALSTSKPSHQSLQQEIKLFLLNLNLSLWSIAHGGVFTWFFTWLQEEPSKQHLKWQLHVGPIQSYPSATDTGTGREILQATLLTTSKTLETAYTKHCSAITVVWGMTVHFCNGMNSGVEGTLFRSYVRISRMSLFSHSPPHTPGVYESLAFPEEVEMTVFLWVGYFR